MLFDEEKFLYIIIKIYLTSFATIHADVDFLSAFYWLATNFYTHHSPKFAQMYVSLNRLTDAVRLCRNNKEVLFHPK